MNSALKNRNPSTNFAFSFPMTQFYCFTILIHHWSLNTSSFNVSSYFCSSLFTSQKMSSQLVVLCMGINSKSFSVIANLEWQPRMITAGYVTSLTSVLSSVGMEKTWKCLEMSHNWILILFAMSCMCSASVFRVRLIFWKSFTYQDTQFWQFCSNIL
jgi:hypothetical protein